MLIWERFLSTLRERIEHINKVIRKFHKHCFKNVWPNIYITFKKREKNKFPNCFPVKTSQNTQTKAEWLGQKIFRLDFMCYILNLRVFCQVVSVIISSVGVSMCLCCCSVTRLVFLSLIQSAGVKPRPPPALKTPVTLSQQAAGLPLSLPHLKSTSNHFIDVSDLNVS